jgi:hypothetical protein
LRIASDRSLLDNLMRAQVYDPGSCQSALARIEARRPFIDDLIDQLDAIGEHWPFRRFQTYQVKLTLYGPGGSFDPETGSVVMLVRPDGSLKQYDDPACTILHEVVHIGIEQSIVSRFDVPHALKERIVDRIVSLSFADQMPEYRVQEMGFKAFDDYLDDAADIPCLPEIVASFLSEGKIGDERRFRSGAPAGLTIVVASTVAVVERGRRPAGHPRHGLTRRAADSGESPWDTRIARPARQRACRTRTSRIRWRGGAHLD